MNSGRDLQQVNDPCGNAKPDLADLRACQQEKGKNKASGKKQLRVLAFKAEAGHHAFERLKDEITDQKRPSDRHKHLYDVVHHGNMAFHVRIVHAHNVQQRGREILPAFQHQLVRPLRKALENQLKQFGYPLCAGAVISLWRQGRKPAEQRGNIGDERADAVDDSPRKPNTLEPVPCLISLLLVIGQLGSDHRDRGHKAGQHGADADDLSVNVYDDPICHRPHILHRESGRYHYGNDQHKRQGGEVHLI